MDEMLPEWRMERHGASTELHLFSLGNFHVQFEEWAGNLLFLMAPCHPREGLMDLDSGLTVHQCAACGAPTPYGVELSQVAELTDVEEVEKWARVHHDALAASMVTLALLERTSQSLHHGP